MSACSSTSMGMPKVLSIHEVSETFIVKGTVNVRYSSMAECLKLWKLTDDECLSLSLSDRRLAQLKSCFASKVFIQHALEALVVANRWGFWTDEDSAFVEEHRTGPSQEPDLRQEGRLRCLSTRSIGLGYSSEGQSQLLERYSAKDCELLFRINLLNVLPGNGLGDRRRSL